MTNDSRTFAAEVFQPEHLVFRLSAADLGFTPATIWNPSPTVTHRTAPWPLPKTLTIGICGNEDTSAKFSPPPFAVGLADEERQALVQVAADPGWHLWNQVVFSANSEGIVVTIDLEGHSDPRAVAAHACLVVTPARPGESRHALLARGLSTQYPQAFVAPSAMPEWWNKPIYCGWGDQVTISMWLEGVGPEARALVYCTQGLYERWIRRLERAKVPFGTVIIDAGWSPAGTLEPNLTKWPDLKGFIKRQHDAGRKVLLWLATWLWEGLPDGWCLFNGNTKLIADPTNPAYREHLRQRVHHLIAPDGLDADGFKIDQLTYAPWERQPRGGAQFGQIGYHKPDRQRLKLHGDGWGCELLHQLQGDIYRTAKAAKPDALLTSSTVHPYFHDTFDMVRLHDMGLPADDIFTAMQSRVDLSRAALPGKPIDTDDWVHTSYGEWLRYTRGSRALGVPCIFYAERFMLNWREEPATSLIPLSDLRRIAQSWRAS